MTHRSQRLAVKQDTGLQDFEILLLVQLGFVSNSHKIDCADTARANAKGCTTNRIDESVKLVSVTEKSATITKYANIIAYEEV